ncbi:MAG TPA: TIM barrel protein [Chthonomonadaceae bacterium]|nr:TIM barrel protein [Chthonomonadaceae bacterium]
MQIGICSFSFHRLLAAGKQDIFQYITDCKALGCTQLDPWNAHLAALKSGDEALHAGRNPWQSQSLAAADMDYIDRVKEAADAAELPFGCIAVDGAHIYEPTEEARAANRATAYRWLDIAARLGAKQVRIDAGGPEEMPDDVFAHINEGYTDLISRGKERGIEIIVENHWGPTVLPDNVIKLMENVEGLGFLLDTHNWRADKRDEGRSRCAKYATATHVKTFAFDAEGNETTEDVPTAIQLLLDAGYKGCWGIESCPRDGDEIGGAQKTIALLRKYVPAY